VEISLLNFLNEKYSHLNVCKPIPSLEGENLGKQNHVIFVVFEYAKGSPVVWQEYKWLTDPEIIHSWGKWFAEFHIASRAFSSEHPELVSKVRHWTALHSGVMKGAPVHPSDKILQSNPKNFGVIHGDLNCSNFFYDSTTKNSVYLTGTKFKWDGICMILHKQFLE